MTNIQDTVSFPRLLSNFSPPRFRKNMLSRQRLIDFLIENNDVALAIISAPAGYGKTTFLADYVSRVIKPCCWLTFDAIDKDPAVFAENLVIAISRTFPGFANNQHFLPNLIEALRDPENGLEVCSRLLVNQIYSIIGADFDLVLDDYQLVEDCAQLNQLLSFFLNYLPSNCRVLLSSRVEVSLELTSLLLRGDVVGIGVNELKMTPNEVRMLLTDKHQSPITEQEACELTLRTEGWVTGIVLDSNKAVRQQSHTADFSNHKQVFSYLASQVLQRLPLELQHFLIDTSVLEELQVDFCNRLLETTTSEHWLLECERRRLFINWVEDFTPQQNTRNTSGSYYRLHNLFREFLLSEFKQKNLARYHELHYRCANLFREQGNFARMMSYLAEAQAYEAIAINLLEVSEGEIEAGRLQSVKSWLELLPPDLYYTRPNLLLLKAQVSGLTAEYPEAYRLLDELQATLSLQPVPSSQYNLIQAMLLRGKILRLETSYSASVEILQTSLKLLLAVIETIADQRVTAPNLNESTTLSGWADQPGYIDWVKARAENELELGMCLGMSGHLSQAIQVLEQARNTYETLQSPERLARVHHYLSLVYAGLHDYVARQRHIETSLKYWEQVGNGPGLVNTLINLAEVHIANGNYAPAEQVLDRALAYTRQIGYQSGLAHVLAFKGDLCRNRKLFTQAYSFYREAETLAENLNEKRLLPLVRVELVFVLRSLNDYATAHQILTEALDTLSAQQKSGDYNVELLRLLQVGIELDQGKLDSAKRLLQANTDFFANRENKREFALKKFLEARLLFLQDKHKQALEALSEALVYAGNHSILKQEAQHALALLQFASARLGRQTQLQPALNSLLEGLSATRQLASGETKVAALLTPKVVDAVVPTQTDIEQEAKKSSSAATPALSMPAQTEKNQTVSSSTPGQNAKAQPDQPLIVFGFGVTEVLVHGTVVHDWRTAKASELLLLLLDAKKPLAKETIVDALWPELDLEQADSLFKSTIYRLRNALSRDWIKRNGSTYSLDVAYWYDVALFEDFVLQGDRCNLSNAHGTPTKLQKEQALNCYSQATALYRGNFMENVYSQWSTERQEVLVVLYVETLLKQSELELQLAKPEVALATIDRCLTADKCNDAAYLLRLRIFKQLGNAALITQTYQQYCYTLKQELNLGPSNEVKALYLSFQTQLNATSA